MPKSVSYIECDECQGHLALVAHTSVGGGCQFGDSHDHSYILSCSVCGQIYVADYSDAEDAEISDFDFAHPGRLVAYNGQLTKEDFIQFAHTIDGHFSVFYHEKKLLEKANRSTRIEIDRATVEAALRHIQELRDAWERGAIHEIDGLGGTRSNRNVEIEVQLRKALEAK